MAGKLSQPQVDSVNAILDGCNKHAVTDLHQISYIIATAYHEARLKPVEEIGKGKGHPYSVLINGKGYWGRGLVQLTWVGNYKTFGTLLGIDLVNRPELAMQTDIAAEIIVTGMKGGIFTGVGLSKYFNANGNDPINARRIINGTDCASLIAGYYSHIFDGLSKT